MSDALPNAPASRRSIMDSCRSVGTGEPELATDLFLFGSRMGRSFSTIFRKVCLRILYRFTKSSGLSFSKRFFMKSFR